MMDRNDFALYNGKKKARAYMDNVIMDNIIGACQTILSDAVKSREFESFTGNTLTSYSCGVYKDGVLVDVFSSGDNLKKPVFRKIRKGDTKFLKHPYEGKARRVKGRVSVDRLSGKESAVKTLGKLRAPKKKGFSMIVTTGTEYSEYLEAARHLNVLSDTLGHVTITMFEKIKGK